MHAAGYPLFPLAENVPLSRRALVGEPASTAVRRIGEPSWLLSGTDVFMHPMAARVAARVMSIFLMTFMIVENLV